MTYKIDFISDTNGNLYSVGKAHHGEQSVVIEIQEHQTGGEGDKWYYDVFYNDGTMLRIFNPENVKFKP